MPEMYCITDKNNCVVEHALLDQQDREREPDVFYETLCGEKAPGRGAEGVQPRLPTCLDCLLKMAVDRIPIDSTVIGGPVISFPELTKFLHDPSLLSTSGVYRHRVAYSVGCYYRLLEKERAKLYELAGILDAYKKGHVVELDAEKEMMRLGRELRDQRSRMNRLIEDHRAESEMLNRENRRWKRDYEKLLADLRKERADNSERFEELLQQLRDVKGERSTLQSRLDKQERRARARIDELEHCKVEHCIDELEHCKVEHCKAWTCPHHPGRGKR